MKTNIIRYAIVSVLAIYICTFNAFAQNDNKQKPDSIALTGKVYDRLTTHHIINTTIEVLSQDSVPLSRTVGGSRFEKWARQGANATVRHDSTSVYSINVPRIEGNYFIKVSKKGYEPYYLSYNLSLNKRDFEKEVPDIFLARQRVKTLDEVTVRASKIKFYNKGDTIIYNVSAFALPEGSMLDALVEQLPGVTIKDNEIYVNGKFVESLLLNGKDFFKGNKNVLLKNIGAYAVKDVAVYEKADEMAYVLGERADVEKEYVMDVRLKKDYMTGYMVNAQAGIGTESRYIGRLFGLQYTNNSRLALYGNANNVNREDNLSDSNRMRYLLNTVGIEKRKNGGVDYSVENTLRTWELTGNVDVTHVDYTNDETSNTVYYLQNANTYEFEDLKTRNRDLSVTTYHDFRLKKDKWNLNIKPAFSYNNNKDNEESSAATFDKEIENLNKEIVDAIYSADYRSLREGLINRNLKIYEMGKHKYNASIRANSRIKIPGSSDAVSFNLYTNYSRHTTHENTLQDICYGFLPESSQLLRRNSATRPEYYFNVIGTGQYYFSIPVGSLNASYEFTFTDSRKNTEILMLEAIAQDGMAEFDPGMLPVPDFANSYTSKSYRNNHQLNLVWQYDKNFNQGKFSLRFQPSFIIENQRLYYNRAGIFATPSRTCFKFNIPRARIQWKSRDKKQDYTLTYTLTQNSVNLVNLVDIRDDVDPLNIILGNPDLKNSTSHNLKFTASYTRSRNLNQSLGFNAKWIANDLISGYRYDSQTGVRTSKMYNVSGNYNLELSHYIYWTFGKYDNFFLENSLEGGLIRYSTMIGYDADPTKQYVNRRKIADDLGLGYDYDDKFKVLLKGTLSFNNTESNSVVPVKSNYGYSGGKIIISANLPANFSISTDFTAVKRFGYIDNSINKVNCNWNAELGYSMLKGALKFTVNANDILNQLNEIHSFVDATGRTQSVTTALPRYVMLSVHYRFDFKPKSKTKHKN